MLNTQTSIYILKVLLKCNYLIQMVYLIWHFKNVSNFGILGKKKLALWNSNLFQIFAVSNLHHLVIQAFVTYHKSNGWDPLRNTRAEWKVMAGVILQSTYMRFQLYMGKYHVKSNHPSDLTISDICKIWYKVWS